MRFLGTVRAAVYAGLMNKTMSRPFVLPLEAYPAGTILPANAMITALSRTVKWPVLGMDHGVRAIDGSDAVSILVQHRENAPE